MLHAVEGQLHSVRLSYALLRRAPMHRGASGKVIAAYLETASAHGCWGRSPGPGSRTSCAGSGTTGFVVTRGELDDGAAAVAAPVLDRRQRLLAGLSLAGPEVRIAAALPGLIDEVLAAAAELARGIRLDGG